GIKWWGGGAGGDWKGKGTLCGFRVLRLEFCVKTRGARPKTLDYLLSDRNHSRRALHQRLAAAFANQHAPAPTGIKTPVRAGDDRFHNKNIALFNRHVAIARAAILRREKRAIVAVAAPVHQHQTLQSAFLAEAVDEVHELGERYVVLEPFQRGVIEISLGFDGRFPSIGDWTQKDRLLFLSD